MQRPLISYKNIPSFLHWTAPIARSFCEVCSWHHLHILVKAPLFCDWKRRAASAQSFPLSHEATIKSHVVLILFLLVRTIWVLFFTHIPFVVNRTFTTMLTERLQHLQQGWARSAMSNPNGFLSQKVCHYLNQGRTLNGKLLRAAQCMAYFDLSKLNLA